MASLFSDEILTEIRARLSIAEVISPYVALRKAGRNHTGLCPFHNENTPSFSVNDERGFFHCFGCGVSGNAFTFLVRLEGISFPEAVRRLAAKAGVSLPQTPLDPEAQERARLFRLNEAAAHYFQRCLSGNAGADARHYLSTRGINPDIAERFRLGYAPSAAEGLVRFLTNGQANLDHATSLGLIGKRDDGRYYDKFRHRLMFPIVNVIGRIIGFGGRLLPSPQPPAAGQSTLPKYLNSADSVLYKKGASLYGLFQAKEAMQQRGRVLMVEGYIDLLALVQYGHAEAVAVLGTALTPEQLLHVRRFTTEVVIFFDGDEAGRKAATRAFPLCVEAGVQGRGVFLPQGHDPDTFARTQGQAALDALIDRAEPLADFYFRQHAPPPGASPLQRAQAAREALAVLKSMTDVIARGALFTQIAQRFGVNEEELRRIATAAAAPSSRPRIAQPRQTTTGPHATAETELIQLMLLDRHAALTVAEAGITAAFQRWQEIALEIIAVWQDNDTLDLSRFLDRLPKAIADAVTRSYDSADPTETAQTRERLLHDCITKIRQTQRRSGREQLRQELQEAERQGDDAGLRSRLRQLQTPQGSPQE